MDLIDLTERKPNGYRYVYIDELQENYDFRVAVKSAVSAF